MSSHFQTKAALIAMHLACARACLSQPKVYPGDKARARRQIELARSIRLHGKRPRQ